MAGAWVYIMTNRPNGTLYVGVTSNLPRRVWEHREGVVAGFTRTHGLKRLVCHEEHPAIAAAIHWRPGWKIALILEQNPAWDDHYELLQ